MPAILTKRFRSHIAEQFVESFTEASPSRYYMFIGRVTAFSDDNSPPTPTDSVEANEYVAYRDMIAMKRIQSSDVSYVIPRYNWTSNTAYKQYDPTDSALFPTSASPSSNTTFYVITEDYNVYKCIDNNRGARSTVKPTGTSTAIVSTADGYRWKFMFKVTAAEALKFLTTNYMPVKVLSANDGSAQWEVQQAAANGAINHIIVTANGSAYLSTTNTFSSVSNSTTLSLANNASGTDNIYNGSTIYISSGLGAGQLRRIVRYVAATKTVTVNGAFTTTPNTSSRYVVGPNIIIEGDSGASSTNRATAYVSNCAGGEVRKITVISAGENYSFANVTISANSSWGSGATARAVISPAGGHGSHPVDELGGYNVMLNVQIVGNESNTFPTNNDFRVIGVLRDPRLRAGPVANASVIDQCTRVNVTGVSGDFTADEIVTGGTSGVKGRFVRFANTNGAGTAGVIRLINMSPTGVGALFTVGEIITGATSGKTANVASVVRPAVREYTGDVIYIENRKPITRTDLQLEDIKVLIKF